MWQTDNIWTENVTEVPNEFLSLNRVPPMKQIKIQVLNLKKPKTHVQIGYLTLITNLFHLRIKKKTNIFEKLQ
jgi:hypothetical protein